MPPISSGPTIYYAHSKNDEDLWNPLAKHLREVAERARDFASGFGAGDDAYLAGLLHDLGKYGDLFQERLKGGESGLDHWSVGASVCLEGHRNLAVALAVEGHHVGLQWWDNWRKLRRAELKLHVAETGRRLTEDSVDVLLDRLRADGLQLPPVVSGAPAKTKPAAAMLDVRMLYSVLTDADYLATEGHFDSAAARKREPESELLPVAAAELLDRHLALLAGTKRSSSAMSAMRQDLLGACRAAALLPTGLFTLTAPTGTGKTLSTLSFALRHAQHNGLRRIVVVMPFLSIIDQTANAYRGALAGIAAGSGMDRYLLEHHSLAIDPDDAVEGIRLHGMLAQNWAAPIVITTSVQFLESLFSNSSSACRKLHRLANSVIIFDEVQTLPLKVVAPTLATLSHLSARYGSTVLFSTATQPAFSHLDEEVRHLSATGWKPQEVVPSHLRLFERAKRVRVEWPLPGERTSWEDLAKQFEGLTQLLCIVNLKRHARALFQSIKTDWGEAAFHLSTSMCPQHRAAVLAEVRARLDDGRRCALVATQCVEAGVDLDFPMAFRAIGPLDAIAQAAGRCNRNGRSEFGLLRVFVPEDEGYPPGGYRQATDITLSFLNRSEEPSIDDPKLFEEYFRILYGVANMEHKELMEAVRTKNFPDVRRYYRIIEEDTVNVLVAYDPGRFRNLADEVRSKRLSRDWVFRARPHTVSCFRKGLQGAMVEKVLLKDGTASDDWFVYCRDGHYDPDAGLHIPKELEYLEG